MLILSRRKAEKVLFPSLGITIEVTHLNGRIVRLGIDAPDEIRIIRGELEDSADLDVRPHVSKSNVDCQWNAPADIRKCLDAANLAIHLAQNQLTQQLNENAEVALEHALECLDKLEQTVARDGELKPTESIRESKSGYQLGRQKVAVMMGGTNQPVIETRLAQHGYQTLHLDSAESLIAYLRTRDQPRIVITASPANVEPGDPPAEPVNRPAELRLFGIGSLQRFNRTLKHGDNLLHGWCAESSDVRAFEDCIG